jgi:hypothetical protein
VAFYCVSSAEYYLGAVALINSLRLIGHDEPVYVLGAGLSDAQRESLEVTATVLTVPADRAPNELKPELGLRHPASTAVLIDVDMIVTRSLQPLIDDALQGRAVAFRNHEDRFDERWRRLPGLGPMTRRPYVCSGLICLGGDVREPVLEGLGRLGQEIDTERACFEGHDDSYELLYADQDVLNAILAQDRFDGRVDALPARLAPMTPFAGLRVQDERRLVCAYADGERPYVVHHSLSPKPWQRPGYDGVYSRLLRRLLNGNDVAVRPPLAEIPPDLRPGLAGRARRLRTKARHQVAWRLGDPPPG